MEYIEIIQDWLAFRPVDDNNDKCESDLSNASV